MRTRRAYIWIAIAVFACAALLPAMSRGLAAGKSTASPWNEICTAAGLRTATGPEERTPGPANQGPTSVQDCPVCLPGNQPLPSQPAPIGPPAADGTSRFLLFFIGAAPAASHRDTAQPRAPPATT